VRVWLGAGFASIRMMGFGAQVERRARRHHPAIVASFGCGRPSSAKASPTLYVPALPNRLKSGDLNIDELVQVDYVHRANPEMTPDEAAEVWLKQECEADAERYRLIFAVILGCVGFATETLWYLKIVLLWMFFGTS